MKSVAVEGCEFNINDVSVLSLMTNSVKANGKKAFVSPMTIAVSNYTDGATIAEGTGVGLIYGSATKTKIENAPAILEGDKCTVILTGVHPVSGAPVEGIEVSVEISSAGQTEVVAE